MIGASTISYRFCINGEPFKLMMDKRGLRQGNPISPFLHRMQLNHNFNHHSSCAKLAITHLTFANDILLFSRGERRYVDMLMQTMSTFYIGLVVNPTKCNAYFGTVEVEVKQDILDSTGFNEGQLLFRYLGVPLTNKKLSLNHYLPLIEKILSKIHH